MLKPKKKASLQDPFICSCNFILKSEIEKVMERGCKNINQIYDATTAGLGACGGSCRPIIKKMLTHHAETGEFLADPKEISKRLKKRST